MQWLKQVNWWVVALIVVLARFSVFAEWSTVVALGVLVIRSSVHAVLQGRKKQHTQAEQARLNKIESELASLSNALTFKNLGRN